MNLDFRSYHSVGVLTNYLDKEENVVGEDINKGYKTPIFELALSALSPGFVRKYPGLDVFVF